MAGPDLRARRRYSAGHQPGRREMMSFLGWKVARALGIVLAVTLLTQGLLGLVPGSIAAAILGPQATAAQVRALNAQLGANRPFVIRYFSWLGNALHGNLGSSAVNGQSVVSAIASALPVTAELVVLSVALALALALVSGVAAARKPGGKVDAVIGAVTSASLSLPAFIVAPVLAYVFAVQLGWVPVLGFVSLTSSIGGNLRSVALPVIAIALPEFAVLQRLLRADLAATLGEDFVDAARGRGVPEGRIIARHALRPSLISLMTATGITIGRLISGTVVVEVFFSLPGIGSLMVRSILARDLIVVQGCVVVIALAYVLINLAVDLAYSLVDPRIRIRAVA
jgi:peptide/nickel transport system permease protein